MDKIENYFDKTEEMEQLNRSCKEKNWMLKCGWSKISKIMKFACINPELM